MRYGHHRLDAMLTPANKSSQQLPLQSNLKILRLTLSRHRRSYHIKMKSPMEMQNLGTAGVIRLLCRGTKHPPPCSCSDYLLTVYAVRICDTDASDARGWPATLRTYAAKPSSTPDRCECRAQATHRFGAIISISRPSDEVEGVHLHNSLCTSGISFGAELHNLAGNNQTNLYIIPRPITTEASNDFGDR
jgi:hypothetical protein